MNDWQDLTLGDVFEISSSKRVLQSDWQSSGVPFYRAREIVRLARDGKVNNEIFVSEELFAEFREKYGVPEPGDLMVSAVGTLGACYVVGLDDRFYYKDASVLRFKAKSEICPRFFQHAFRTAELLDQVHAGSGSTVGTYTIERANNTHVRVPPLTEQRRIATILDKADALRTQRREALAQLDLLAQAIFVEMFGDPVQNLKGWDSRPLTEVCHCHSGGTPSKERADYWVGDVPWFSAKDLKKTDLFDSQDHISRQVFDTSSLRLLPENTVTVVVRGMILAHTFPVSVLRVPAAINQDLKALLPKIDLPAQFLANCLRAQAGHVLSKVSEAGHGTKRLDSEGLASISVLLPPQRLQDIFESRVKAQEQLRLTHSSALASANALFTSLQYRAFRGEL